MLKVVAPHAAFRASLKRTSLDVGELLAAITERKADSTRETLARLLRPAPGAAVPQGAYMARLRLNIERLDDKQLGALRKGLDSLCAGRDQKLVNELVKIGDTADAAALSRQRRAAVDIARELVGKPRDEMAQGYELSLQRMQQLLSDHGELPDVDVARSLLVAGIAELLVHDDDEELPLPLQRLLSQRGEPPLRAARPELRLAFQELSPKELFAIVSCEEASGIRDGQIAHLAKEALLVIRKAAAKDFEDAIVEAFVSRKMTGKDASIAWCDAWMTAAAHRARYESTIGLDDAQPEVMGWLGEADELMSEGPSSEFDLEDLYNAQLLQLKAIMKTLGEEHPNIDAEIARRKTLLQTAYASSLDTAFDAIRAKPLDVVRLRRALQTARSGANAMLQHYQQLTGKSLAEQGNTMKALDDLMSTAIEGLDDETCDALSHALESPQMGELSAALTAFRMNTSEGPQEALAIEAFNMANELSTLRVLLNAGGAERPKLPPSARTTLHAQLAAAFGVDQGMFS